MSFRFAGIIMAALAFGATPTAYAADGWFNNAKVNLVFANATGELRIRTDPQPQNAEGQNFGCTQATIVLGLQAGLQDDALERFALGRMYEAVLEAMLTGASVDMYLDEVSSGNAVACYVNRLQIHTPPAQTPTTTPTTTPNPNPPNPNPPENRDYYGAFAVHSLSGGTEPWQYGHATNRMTQAQADSVAANRCAARGPYSFGCFVYARFGNGECLVVHTGNDGRYMTYGTGPRAGVNDFEREGLAYCQGSTTGCSIAISDCNSGTYSGIAPQTPWTVLQKR